MAGGGAGFMLDMIYKVRENLSMLPSKRSKFKEHGKKEFSIAPSNEKYEFRKVSEEELKKTLIRIKEDAAKERKRRIIGSIIAGLLAALSMCLILYYLDQVFK